MLWARSPEVAEEIDRQGRNSRYLGDSPLSDGLRATDSLEQAVRMPTSWSWVSPPRFPGSPRTGCVPRASVDPGRQPGQGAEQVTDHRMTEIVAEVLPGHPAGVLAGPNIAKEMVGYAAAATIAMPDQNLAARLADLFRTARFRIYSTTDVAGVEIAGALKNVFAIGAGMAEGPGPGTTPRRW